MQTAQDKNNWWTQRLYLKTMLHIQYCLDVRGPRGSRFRPFVIAHFSIIVSTFFLLISTNRDETTWLPSLPPHSPTAQISLSCVKIFN